MSDSVLRYRDYFDVDWAPLPTALGEVVLSLLARVLPPLLTEKAYYVILGFGLWWSAGYYVKALGQHALVAVMLFPLLHDFFFFSAFFPYIGSVVIYPALLSTLLRARPGGRKQILLALLMIASYGFHLVAAVVACFTALFFAIDFDRKRLRLPELPCILPTALLLTYYQVTKPPSEPAVFFGPIGQIKTFFGHNAWSLSSVGSVLFVVLTAILVVTAIRHARRGTIRDYRLFYLALLLVIIGLVMPFQMGAGAMIGARTFPFAVISVVGAISWTAREARLAFVCTFLFLTVSSVLNTRRELAVQKDYNVFLSGMSIIPSGSKILPIVEDLSYGGNKYIQPFNSVEDLYNVFRGGSNPYAFAMPFAPTGTLLRTKYPLTYIAKFSTALTTYKGVAADYDYIVCWGELAATKQLLDREASVVFRQGLLTIYQGKRTFQPRSGS